MTRKIVISTIITIFVFIASGLMTWLTTFPVGKVIAFILIVGFVFLYVYSNVSTNIRRANQMTKEETVLRKLERILVNDITGSPASEDFYTDKESYIHAQGMTDGVKVALYEINKLIKDMKADESND